MIRCGRMIEEGKQAPQQPRTVNEQIGSRLQALTDQCFAEHHVSNIRELMEQGDESIKAGVHLIEEIVRLSSEAAMNTTLPLGNTAGEIHRLLMPEQRHDTTQR